MWSLVVIVVLSYLTGSLPTSIVLSRVLRGIDIRDYGSGNAGGTNTVRILGWKIGAAVIVVDIGKGVLAALLISQIRIDPVIVSPDLLRISAGSAAIVGHIWTVFARFKGGKGVATGAGMLFSLYPEAGLVCLIIFTLVLFFVRIVSVSSMAVAVSLPVVLFIQKTCLGDPVSNELLYFAILAAVLILFTHRSNIKRLLKGEESRFKRTGFNKSKS